MMKKYFKYLLLTVFTGAASGLLSSAFLHSLNLATELRITNPEFIYALPLFGILFALIIKRIPHDVNQGVPYLLSEIENEKAKVSVWMAPYIFITSIGTHIFGGSAGREGVGVIMGASISHLPTKIFKDLNKENLRALLIYTGIAAGFASIFGTPFAAFIFAFELHHFKEIKRVDLLFFTAIACASATFIANILGPAHAHFQVILPTSTSIVWYLIIASLCSGLGANIFYFGMKYYTKAISLICKSLEIKLFTGSLLIVALVLITNGHDYIGIGTHIINDSFIHERSIQDFFLKALLTIMTLSIGFKGGEVTPLFFMGATLTNAVSSKLGLMSFSFSSALGMVGLFGAVTNTPLASSIMAMELFGPRIGCFTLISCYFAKFMMGKRSIYRH